MPANIYDLRCEDYFHNPRKIASEHEFMNTRISIAGDNLLGLEKKLKGGLKRGNLYTLAGTPLPGKTTLLNNIADNLCLNGYPVLFCVLHVGF